MITAVVAVGFDRDSDEAIGAVAATLPTVGSRHQAPRVAPHMTLSAARVSRMSQVTAVAREVAARHRPFRITLRELGEFPQVVWFGPRRTARLTRLHQDVWQSMIDAGWPPAFAGQSDPASWVPHCTLVRGRLMPVPFEPEPLQVRVASLAMLIVGRGEVDRIPLG